MNSLPTARHFGYLPSGESIQAWTLTGASGLVLEVLSYGGIVTSLRVPDAEGKTVDVVLGFDRLEPYVAGHPYMGAIVGRVAGRTTGARIVVDGETYPLSKNEAPNHLHGGVKGFDKQVWKATPQMDTDGSPSLQLTYRSPAGEEGYPGNVDVTVTYTLTQDHGFVVETSAISDQITPLSLTNHSYFNLAGEGSGTIGEHTLHVDAASYIATDDRLTLQDRLEPVDGKPEDLRTSQRLAEAIPQFQREGGPLYCVNKPGNETLVKVAELTHPATGRILTCFTTTSYLQIYTASAFDGSLIGKSGKAYPAYSGLCLECEGYPNGANSTALDDILLRPGIPQRHRTTYAFSTKLPTE